MRNPLNRFDSPFYKWLIEKIEEAQKKTDLVENEAQRHYYEGFVSALELAGLHWIKLDN